MLEYNGNSIFAICYKISSILMYQEWSVICDFWINVWNEAILILMYICWEMSDNVALYRDATFHWNIRPIKYDESVRIMSGWINKAR